MEKTLYVFLDMQHEQTGSLSGVVPNRVKSIRVFSSPTNKHMSLQRCKDALKLNVQRCTAFLAGM